MAYIPRALRGAPERARHTTEAVHWTLSGTLVLLDIVGFTPLTERFSQAGRTRTEEFGVLIDGLFSQLLEEVRPLGGDMVSFGGDSLLVLFTGTDHAVRGAGAACAMRDGLRAASRAAGLGLSSSMGVHTGDELDLVVAGELHRELLVTGPHASRVVALQKAAGRDEILVSAAIERELPARAIGHRTDGSARLRHVDIDGSLAGAVEAAVPQLSARELALHVPVLLRAHTASSALTGEHRRVTVGCVRFSGTDALRNTDGDLMAAAVHELITSTQQAAHDEGVCFLTTDVADDGGLIMLTSGAPSAHEDDTPRLARVCRRVLDTSLRLKVSAGAARGLVFSGPMGPSHRRLYRVIGDAANLAARLSNAAAAHELLVPDTMREGLDGRFALFARGEMQLKGKRHPVPVLEVGGTETARSSRGGTLPLLGRERERAALMEVLADARDGSGQVVELHGAAGAGKTRLLEELGKVVVGGSGEGTARLLHVIGDAARYMQVFAALGGALRAMHRIPAAAEPRDAGGALLEIMARSAPDQLPLAPLIAPVLDAEVAMTPEVAALGPSFIAGARRRAVERWLAAAARPLVVLLDEGRDLDGASRDLLDHLAHTAAGHGWVFVVTRREDEPLPFDLVPDRSLALGGLDRVTSRRLAQLVSGGGLDAQGLHDIDERARGNPLFIAELSRALVDGLGELPDTLETLVAARLDACDPEVGAAARQAAVLGATFPEDLLASVAGVTDESVIKSAIGHGIFERPAPGTLAFRHPMFREAAYAGLASRDRRALHERAARELEGRSSPSATLAPHYQAAGLFALAWQHATRGAAEARRMHANDDAVALYRIAVAASSHLDKAPADLSSVYEALGDLSELAGGYRDARHHYRRARAACGSGGRPSLYRKEGLLHEREGRYDLALSWYRRALRAMDGLDVVTAAGLRAETAIAIAGVKYRQGKFGQCIRWCEGAITDATAISARHQIGHAYFLLAGACADMGDARASIYREVAKPIFEEEGDLVMLATVINNLGVDAYYAGEWLLALEHYEESISLFERAGDVVMAATARNNIGEIRSDQGRLDEAGEWLTVALDDWRAARYPLGVALATSNLGRLATRAGDLEKAAEWLAEAETRFATLGARAYVLEANARRAETLIAAGSYDAALGCLDTLVSQSDREGGTAFLMPMLLRLLGDARRAAGDEAGAVVAYEASCARAEALGGEFELATTLLRTATVGSPELDRATATLDRLGVARTPGQ
jgi:class 3 adenylate cyclase/tetratricopeptide (TPR) repeat protein